MGRFSSEQIRDYISNQIEKQKLFTPEVFDDGVRIRLSGGPVVGSVTIDPRWVDIEEDSELVSILNAALKDAFSGVNEQAVLRSKGRDAKKVSVG